MVKIWGLHDFLTNDQANENVNEEKWDKSMKISKIKDAKFGLLQDISNAKSGSCTLTAFGGAAWYNGGDRAYEWRQTVQSSSKQIVVEVVSNR